TLPRLAASEPLDTGRASPRRRISATFKDLPGGQILGPTFDYTHRLLDFALAAEGEAASTKLAIAATVPEPAPPRVSRLIGHGSLLEANAADDREPPDLTREPLEFPAERALRLQNLARGDEGFLLSLGYSTQRGYGRNLPFAGEIRIADVEVEIMLQELG